MATKKESKKETKRRIPPIVLEDAKMIFRNFSGAAKTFNAKGLRNFNVVLDPEFAKVLEIDGWNVKWGKPREEGDTPEPRLKVTVRFDNYPPKILLITKRGRSMLNEETVGLLDTAEIEHVDMKIAASTGFTPKEGEPYVKAYLSEMYVTLSEKDLASKYLEVSPARHTSEND